MKKLCADVGDVSDEPQSRIRRRDRQQSRILARNAYRDRFVAGLAVDRGDEIAIDLPDQHHAHDLERLRVRHSEPVAKLRLLAYATEHVVDLRAAAVNQDAAHPDAPQQKHVLRQREVGLAVDRRAAELHDDRFSAPLPDVGKRLDEDARGLDRGHDVLLFSRM
jgi:hypothetical protein